MMRCETCPKETPCNEHYCMLDGYYTHARDRDIVIEKRKGSTWIIREGPFILCKTMNENVAIYLRDAMCRARKAYMDERDSSS